MRVVVCHLGGPFDGLLARLLVKSQLHREDGVAQRAESIGSHLERKGRETVSFGLKKSATLCNGQKLQDTIDEAKQGSSFKEHTLTEIHY